jgi:hypothetical protein
MKKFLMMSVKVSGLPLETNRQPSSTTMNIKSVNLLTSMTNNTHFSSPFPPLSDLQTAIDELNAANAASQSGVSGSGTAVNAAKRKLNRVLKAMAAYVEYVSDDDETVAVTSGFNFKQPTHSTPNVFMATQGVQSGTVDLSSPGIGGAYAWEYTLDPIGTSAWLPAATTILANYTVTGLTPGLKYWFRVAAITNEGQQPFGNPIMVHVI